MYSELRNKEDQCLSVAPVGEEWRARHGGRTQRRGTWPTCLGSGWEMSPRDPPAWYSPLLIMNCSLQGGQRSVLDSRGWHCRVYAARQLETAYELGDIPEVESCQCFCDCGYKHLGFKWCFLGNYTKGALYGLPRDCEWKVPGTH